MTTWIVATEWMFILAASVAGSSIVARALDSACIGDDEILQIT